MNLNFYLPISSKRRCIELRFKIACFSKIHFLAQLKCIISVIQELSQLARTTSSHLGILL